MVVKIGNKIGLRAEYFASITQEQALKELKGKATDDQIKAAHKECKDLVAKNKKDK